MVGGLSPMHQKEMEGRGGGGDGRWWPVSGSQIVGGERKVLE